MEGSILLKCKGGDKVSRKFLTKNWIVIYCPKCLRIKKYGRWTELNADESRELSVRITNNCAKCQQKLCPDCDGK